MSLLLPGSRLELFAFNLADLCVHGGLLASPRPVFSVEGHLSPMSLVLPGS